MSCPSVQQILPERLKTGLPGKVSFQTWLLFGLNDLERILMSLYVHAIYIIHNMYCHSCDRDEFRQTAERIVLEIPLRQQQQQLQASINYAISENHSQKHSTPNLKQLRFIVAGIWSGQAGTTPPSSPVHPAYPIKHSLSINLIFLRQHVSPVFYEWCCHFGRVEIDGHMNTTFL